MSERKEKLFFVFFICLLFAFFLFMPMILSEKNIFLGGDAVGGAGTVEQVFLKIKSGKAGLFDVFIKPGVILDEINWPDGFYVVPNIATGINVILRFFFFDEISAFTATLILFEILNILSVFFILRKILNVNFFLSIFFSVIIIFFPYFYYRLHHQNLVAFWQEIFLIYFILRFIEKPGIKYSIYIIVFVFINIFFNIQTSYFLFLSFFPALFLGIAYRIITLTEDKKNYLKKIIFYAVIIIFFSGIIFYISPYGKIFEKNNKIYERNILPERNKEEIQIWKAPIYYLFLPTDQNILFGKLTGRKFMSKWGYHEKAIYLGISFLFSFVFLICKLYKNIKIKFINYSFESLFLITGFFIFLFSLFWAIAPNLHLENFLYSLNKSARVYGRAISLAIVFWVVIFAFLINYMLKNKFIKYNMVSLILVFILLDIFPKNFTPLILKLERCPEEYIFLSKKADYKEKLLDYFGRYGGYAEYGYLLYKKCHNLIDFNLKFVDNKWGKELYDVLKKYNIKYVLFYKNNKEKDIDENKINEFIKNFKLKKIYENKRSIIVEI